MLQAMVRSGLGAGMVLLLMGCNPVCCPPEQNEVAPPAAAVPQDPRQLVEMPPQAREYMRQDMLDHLAALNEIMGYMADENWVQAAEVAEARMGRRSMGKYRGTGFGPGRFMPDEMRNIGWAMHDAASEFAEVAKTGDGPRAYAALQKVTASCMACHYAYRTR